MSAGSAVLAIGFRMHSRHVGPLLAAGLALGSAGCGTPARSLEIPPPGQPMPHVNVLEEHSSGPIVLLFPGRSAPVDDASLGILQTAERISERLEGSVGLFNVYSYEAARLWVERQSLSRAANGERRRLALVGHSWGGGAAGQLMQELFDADLIDEVTVLVTMDAIVHGYLRTFLYHFPAVVTLESVFPHRFRHMALTELPAPDGRRLLEHINYYQIDSPHLCGDAVPTASQNHEVWFDRGTELGHGNLDNYIRELVAEDVVRAMERGAS